MRRTFPLLLATAVTLPLSNAVLGSAPFANPVGTRPVYAAARASAVSHIFRGPSTNMRWGPVQVTIVVQGTRLTGIQASAPVERARSAIINNRAIPMLCKEALQARTAKVQLISGATMTSRAFVTSLQAAIARAHL